MTIRKLRRLLRGYSGEIVVMIRDPKSDDTTWYNIKELDTSAKDANEFGQVVIILEDEPCMH